MSRRCRAMILPIRLGWPLLVLAGLLLVAPVSAPADGGGGGGGGGGDGGFAGGSRAQDPEYTAAVKAIEAGDYRTAIRLLESVVARDGRNADAYNWLAYAIRQTGEVTKAIPLYQKALAIDPKHRGAHEYLGEAYLILGDLQKAKEHLTRLDALCFFPCSQYRDLKKAVQAYEASGGSVRPTAKAVR
jgi:predicted Zn-dependent protease